jgi:hypothetical protein
MVIPIAGRLAPRAALIVAIGTLLLAGCALIQPPPVVGVPHLGRAGPADAACAGDVGRAHAALSAAGAAAGDPAATAAAHAASATAMHAYHTCLAQPGRQ